MLVSGPNVTSYVPKGNWSNNFTGVSVVNVEGSSITPTLILTPSPVNSCASNSVTGTTVCTANNTDVYLLNGTTLSNTLTSGAGNSFIHFSGGFCTNCGVTMDAIHNKAVIGLSVGPTDPMTGFGAPGYQFLDLPPVSVGFAPGAVSSPTPTPVFEKPPVVSPAGMISEGILIDPIHNLLLSAAENGNYEISNVSTIPPSLNSSTAAFFENVTEGGELDSSAEDCSTGIALAPAEQFAQSASSVFITNLPQAPIMSSPWTTPSQNNQILSESILANGADGIAVAQGTHIGIVSGENGGNAVTAIVLPTTAGPVPPKVIDWVTCNVGGNFINGADPHTVTAYQSPSSGDAIALLANQGATSLAVVDLTKMLNITTVRRTVDGHACALGTLPLDMPDMVVRFISVP